MQYQGTCGWWNDNCSPEFEFGIEEFLGLWILMESNYGLERAEVIATVVAQNLYVGGDNPAYCTLSVCYNGVFNFMAAYSQGVGGLFSGPNNATNQKIPINSPQLRGAEGARQLISGWGGKALNYHSVVSWDKNRGPTHWGNIVGGSKIPKLGIGQKGPVYFGIADNTVYYNVGTFTVFSLNQREFLIAMNVDMTLTMNP